MKIAIYISLIFFSYKTFSQEKPFREIIETDSSKIEIIRNSVYRCYEETYKNKDSIWWNVTYIDDTTRLHTEGWKRKNGTYLGKWSEFDKNGTWLYTIDYNTDTWKYNNLEYPFQLLLDSMKSIADDIIIQKYGKTFFDYNVTFKYHGNLAIYDSITYATGTYWSAKKQLGAWVDPIKEKPNTFTLNYTIKLDESHFYYDLLRIDLDSLGNHIDDSSPPYLSFKQRKKPNNSKFSLTYDKAIEICKINGLKISDTLKLDAGLRFGSRNYNDYAGTYYFEVKQLYDTKTEGKCPEKCTVALYYNLWRINPWNSELLYHKKVKQMQYWSNGHGHRGNYEEIE